MISLGYMYMNFFNGSLGWDFMNFNVDKNEKQDKMSIFSNNNIQRKELKSWVSLEPVVKT
jgi:hypothetical protein